MVNFSRAVFITVMTICSASLVSAQQPPPGQSSTPATATAFAQWGDEFNGQTLDTSKWERFTFEGGSGGKVEVKDGQLRMRGMGASRSGVRSKPAFVADRFIVEATVSKVGEAQPEEGQRRLPIGNAILTILFDGSGRNRIEWILTSEGTFEAWSVIDGRGERLDNRKLATKVRNPTLGVVRRGDEFFFMLNGQPGLQKMVRNLPRAFHVMLYGYGSSENDWKSVRVVTPKQP